MERVFSPGSSDRELLERLRLCVEACAARADQVAAVLEEEGRMLRAGDLDQLEPLLRRKSEYLADLEAAETDWRTAYAETGLPEGRNGVRLLLRSADEELRAAWDQLEERISAVQLLNEANGRLIHRNLAYRRRLMEILAQGGEEDAPVTYGTDGNRSPAARSRNITRA